jgi:hypothetical protein
MHLDIPVSIAGFFYRRYRPPAGEVGYTLRIGERLTESLVNGNSQEADIRSGLDSNQSAVAFATASSIASKFRAWAAARSLFRPNS